MFNVGDTVTIRPDLKRDELYNNMDVSPDMVELAGRSYTILECFTRNKYITETIYHLDGDARGWNWTEAMFVDVSATAKEADESLITALYCC